jgi:serine/threonine protein kinase/WD40 repeat protein
MPAALSGRERELFLTCLELAPGEPRQRFLAAECGPDEPLRQAVESLLGHHQADDFLEHPAINPARPTPPATGVGLALGSLVGPYRLLAELGTGGCGMVFEAEQEHPVRRRVALKVIKPGMDSRAVSARFEAERQVLALLEHPHIARVLDAGTTSTGQPYFVMELVSGAPITRFCREQQLDLPARLQLFLRVAAAVDHAHQRGIIHRDLKPTNILVSRQDGEAWPRVIDFGVAKAIGPRLSDHSTLTLPGHFIGTPAYMSPEQADLKLGAIDARTDVYSLGVLLYELLTGAPPFDPQGLVEGGLEAMRRTIREEEPIRPSVRVRARKFPPSVVGDQPGANHANPLALSLTRDLDWIVLKALEKDRERRYANVAALSLDLRRTLAHEPISARPPAPLYRLWKLIRRHPLAFASASAFLAPLTLGLSLLGWQLAENRTALEQVAFAEREKQLQNERAQRAQDSETRLRQEAGALSLAARRQAYAHDLNLAQQALAANNLGRTTVLLDRQRPAPGQSDLRGWEWRYLWQQTRSEARFTLGQATNEIKALTVSADGRWLVATEDNEAIAIWRPDQRQEVIRRPPERRRGPIAISPDGAWLAHSVGPVDGPGRRPDAEASPAGVALFDVPTGAHLTTFTTAAPVLGFTFSPTGHQLLLVTLAGELQRWEMTTRQVIERRQLEPSRRFGEVFAASPDLHWVAYVTPDDHLAVFATATGLRQWRSPNPIRDLRRLRFAPDNRHLAATGGRAGPSAVRRWAVASGAELAPLTGHSAWVADVAFSRDGATVATASADQTVRLWDATTGEARRTLRGHRLEVWSLAWSADGRWLFSGSKDGTINAWEPAETPRHPAAITGPTSVRSWSFAPDQRAVLTLEPGGRVHRWELAGTNAPKVLLELGRGLGPTVFSTDGRHLAVGRRAGGVQVWNLESAPQVRDLGSPGILSVPLALPTQTDTLITLQPRERTFTRWSLGQGEALETWPAEAGFRGFPFIATSVLDRAPHLAFLAVSDTGQAELSQWNPGRRRAFELGLRRISGVALAPDGNHFAVASGLGRAALWQIEPPQLLADLGGFLLGTHGVGFAPDGQRIAVASLGREAVKLFDASTGQELLTLAGDELLFTTVQFSNDGRWLGASGPDGTLKLWWAPTQDEINAAENASR